jgi:hypothetical protein
MRVKIREEIKPAGERLAGFVSVMRLKNVPHAVFSGDEHTPDV